MRVFDISERLACRLVGLARSSFRRQLNGDTIADPDQALRLSVQARNNSWVVNHKKIQHLSGEKGLQVIVKRLHKRSGVSDLPTISKEEAPGDVWAVDFKFHSTVAGEPLKILSIADAHTGEDLGG